MPKRAAQVSRRRFVGGLVLAALAAPSLARGQIARIDPSQPFSAPTIDMALVLAVDCSRSIDADEYRLQAMGYAAAFRSERVRKAALGGRRGAIAVAMTQWGGQRAQELVLDWTLVADPAGLENLAARLAVQPRRIDDDATSISGAIDHARRQFATLPYAAERRVIDVSGDGINNSGRPAYAARDEAVSRGVVINGLVIMNDNPNPGPRGFAQPPLDEFYREQVIGGPGAFVIAIDDFESFAYAIVNKLIKEIAGFAVDDGIRLAEAK